MVQPLQNAENERQALDTPLHTGTLQDLGSSHTYLHAIDSTTQEEKQGEDNTISAVEIFTDSIPLTPTLDELDIPNNILEADVALFSDEIDLFEDIPFEYRNTWILPVVPLKSTLSSKTPRKEEKGYVRYIRKLVTNTGIYAVASFATPLVALVLSPFLTHHLSRAEYGAFAVLTTTIALLVGLTQLGLNAAFFRSYSYDYESKEDRAGVVSTTSILLLLITVPVALLILLLAPQISVVLLNNASFVGPVRFLGIAVLCQNLTIPGFAWLRAENRALYFTLLSIANLVTSLITTIVLVGIVHMGITGAILAPACGYAVVVFFTFPAILLHAGLRFRLDIARGLLSFGLPNVSAFISIWILQLSDRFLLSHLGSLSETASYSIAYTLGGVLGTLVLAPFTLAWPSAMYSIAKKENAQQVFGLVFRWYSIVLLFATFGLSRVSTALLTLFFPPSYLHSAPVIPIVAVSIMCYGLYNMFTIGLSIRRKPWLGVLFTSIAAVLNIGFNILLIPHFGSLGAALSTLLAYAILAIITYGATQRIYPIPFEIGLFLLALSLGVILYVTNDVLMQGRLLYWMWGTNFVALILYTVCLVCIGLFLPRNKGQLGVLLKGFSL